MRLRYLTCSDLRNLPLGFVLSGLFLMIEPVYNQTDLISQWVASQPPFSGTLGFGNCVAIGWAENGVIIAGTVYHNWEPKAGVIELSTASKSSKWLTRQTLHAMFSYPFEQVGCQMVLLRTSANNVSESGRGINRISKAFGFEQVVIPRLYGRDEDGIIHLLTVEKWRSVASRFTKLQSNNNPDIG